MKKCGSVPTHGWIPGGVVLRRAVAVVLVVVLVVVVVVCVFGGKGVVQFVLGYRHGTAYSAHTSTACRLTAIYILQCTSSTSNAVLRPSTGHIGQQFGCEL
jgi:hypothetical protein